MHTIIRVTTVPISLKFLLKGQLKYMQQNGFKVIAASAAGAEVEDIKQNEKCDHYCFPLTRNINPLMDFICLIKFILFLKKFKPTIVHSHTPKAGLIAMLAAYFAKVPIRLHTIAGLPWMEKSGIKKKILKYTESLTVAASSAVYVNSNNLLSVLKSENINSKKYKVLGNGSSNGIDVNYFKTNKDIQYQAKELRKQCNINDDNYIWLFVGRIVKDKGIQELIAAFEKISQLFNKDQLWLVGEKENHLDPLDEKYKIKLNRNKNIIQWGFKNDVRPFYEAANMLVFPSYREGFPNVPMQAALMHCGLILSNINGCNEIVQPSYCGLLVEPKSTTDLIDKMLYARYNMNVVDILKNQAYDFVSTNFSQDKVWNNILNEYKTLIAKRGL